MHPFFEPLDEREAMLLLTALTVGGSADTGIFQHLPADRRPHMAEKAQALLAMPSDKRVSFMVHEIKQALSFKGLRGLERIDPAWIVLGLKGENARVVATVLISLPNPVVRAVLKRLPSGIRKQLPPKEEVSRIPLELVRAVREIFESRFHAMPAPSARGFAFRDILQLERPDLYRLTRDLGLIELGQAFVSVGRMALAELCRRLPRDKAEELILAVRSASTVDIPDVKSAQRFLARVVVNFEDTEEFFTKAGLWRLARAALIEDPSFRTAFKQRLAPEAGRLFVSYAEKAAELQDVSEEAVHRLQDSVLVRIRELSRRGLIAPQWQSLEMVFHQPPAQNAG